MKQNMPAMRGEGRRSGMPTQDTKWNKCPHNTSFLHCLFIITKMNSCSKLSVELQINMNLGKKHQHRILLVLHLIFTRIQDTVFSFLKTPLFPDKLYWSKNFILYLMSFFSQVILLFLHQKWRLVEMTLSSLSPY